VHYIKKLLPTNYFDMVDDRPTLSMNAAIPARVCINMHGYQDWFACIVEVFPRFFPSKLKTSLFLDLTDFHSSPIETLFFHDILDLIWSTEEKESRSDMTTNFNFLQFFNVKLSKFYRRLILNLGCFVRNMDVFKSKNWFPKRFINSLPDRVNSLKSSS